MEMGAESQARRSDVLTMNPRAVTQSKQACRYTLIALVAIFITGCCIALVVMVVKIGANHSGSDEPPTPPVLPSAFSIGFTMAGKHRSLPNGWDSSLGMLYYDWDSRRQRIDHGENSSQCKLWYKTLDPCTEYFTNHSGEVWVVVHHSGKETCCLQSCSDNCTEDATPLPRPDYAKYTEYHGVEVMNGTKTTRWDSMMVSWFTLPGNLPFKFSTPPDAEGRTDRYAMYYNVSSMKLGPQLDALFEVPGDCIQARKKCTWKAPGGPPGFRAWQRELSQGYSHIE